jgi:hypothetical protein
MPDVALGRARWAADDEQHLAGCADCRAEWALVSGASRLGESLAEPDPARIADRVLARLVEERARSRVRARGAVIAGLAAAAAVALAVWAGRGGRGAPPGERGIPVPAPLATSPARPTPAVDSQMAPLPRRPATAAPLELALPELDSLPAEVLDSILHALDEPLAHVGTYDLPPDESGDRELEQVLAGLEG